MRIKRLQRNTFPAILAILASIALVAGCETSIPNAEVSPATADSSAVRDLNQQDFEEAVLNSEQPVLVEFWAPWCGPCQVMKPTLQQLAGELAGSATVVKVNADDNPQLLRDYDVSALPTMLVFFEGQVVDRITGVASQEQLEKALTVWADRSRKEAT